MTVDAPALCVLVSGPLSLFAILVVVWLVVRRGSNVARTADREEGGSEE